MSVLVTGSSGMIGTHLCQKLFDNKIEFVGIDKRPNNWDSKIQEKTIIGDLRSDAVFSKLRHPVSMVVHLAAQARVLTSIEHPDEALENFTTTFNVLEFARKNGIQQIILASSKEVYGMVSKRTVKESDFDITRSENPYAASKVSCESLAFAYHHSYGLNPIILRFSNVYGEYDTNPRAIPILMNKAIRSEPLIIYGKDKKLDFVYAGDVAEGILLSMQNYPKMQNQAFNIGLGKAVSLVRIANMLQRLLNKKLSISIEENRVGEIRHFAADISKMKKTVGFTPTMNIQEGLQKTLKWKLQTYAE